MESKPPFDPNLLRLSKDKNELMLVIAHVQGEVSAQNLLELFNSSQYNNLKLNRSALQQAVQLFTRKQKKAAHRNTKLESIVIAKREDATLTLNFDPLKMIAKAVITSAYGGLPLTVEQLKKEMVLFGIKHGIIGKNIAILIEKSRLAEPGTSFQATIAKGTPPINGSNSKFERLVETPQERLLRPQKNKDGSVDMRNLGELITVKPGTDLMRKVPHSIGSPGMTVTGEYVKNKTGKDISLVAGINTRISYEDENLLIATLAGIPKAITNGMKVDDVLVVNNVDVGYGHVNYEGSVIVEGDVLDGMEVKASGDITISGFVESALLECGGDLIVGKGIIGRKIEEGSDNYSCEAHIAGSVTAHFSQYSEIIAGAEINISKQLLHCKVSSKGDINVQDESGQKGTILGGTLRTTGSINTVSLGASAGSKTQIDLIGNYPNLMQHKKQINNSIQSQQGKLRDLIDAHRKVDALPDSEKKQVLDGRLILTKEQVKSSLSTLHIDLENNMGEIRDYFEQTQVVTQKEMFNDVYVRIGKDKFRSDRNYGPTKVHIKNHKIIAEPYRK